MRYTISRQLNTFPNEILLHIFEELNIYDIHHCLLTCRVFHETIRDALILQYLMELAVAGVEDGHADSRRSIAERLAQLKNIEQGWANLHFRQKRTVPWPSSHLWELYGGVIARGIGAAKARGLAFMRLPSAEQGTPVHTWEHKNMGVNIRDFAIDPAQDLAVLISQPVTVILPRAKRSRKFPIHLRAMSSASDHPSASDPVLSCIPKLGSPNYSFIIQIMGDFLAVLFHTAVGSLKAQLFIWDWKTGRLLTSLRASTLGNDIASFSFLSRRHFIIARCTLRAEQLYQPELDVYDFLAVSPEESTEPRLVRRYQLPHVVEDAVALSIVTRSDPSPETPSLLSTTLGSSFSSAPSSRLLVVSMDFRLWGDGVDSYVLFVHHSSLLEGVDATSMLNDKIIPWENWGPKKTRMIGTLFNESTWVCYVHGTRYVRVEPGRIGIDGNFIRMLDFNQLALRRELALRNLTTEDRSSEEGSGPSNAVVDESQPTIIDQCDSIFVQSISTTLPYREVKSKETFMYDAVMIDRDCLVGLRWPPLGAIRDEIDLLYV